MGVKNNKFNVRSNWTDSYLSGKSKAYNTGQLGALSVPPPTDASGGTMTTPGDGYNYHFFTTAGSEETLTNATGTPKSAEYVIIGGGGAGGNGPDTGSYLAAGGGGAGLYRSGPITLTDGVGYKVYVANGAPEISGPDGAAPYPGNTGGQGGSGEKSWLVDPTAGISSITSDGGGGGGGATNRNPGNMGFAGGSGGGSGGYGGGTNPTGTGSGVDYPGSPPSFPSPPDGWGNDGGAGSSDGGGGGGAGAIGGPGGGTYKGGDGIAAFNASTGIPPAYGTPGPSAGRWFAAGGGGGTNPPASANVQPGGAGGGGAGGWDHGGTQRYGIPGTTNTGSGGGGTGSDNYPASEANGKGGSGGPGIVMVRYPV